MARPIHFLVHGTPVSFQSKRETVHAWKRKIASIARARVRTPSVDEELAVCITHFYKRPPRCDTDNMAKPIFDALSSIVYRDDWQIVECVARRIPISRAFTLWDMLRELALALCDGREFVSISVSTVRAATLPALWKGKVQFCL